MKELKQSLQLTLAVATVIIANHSVWTEADFWSRLTSLALLWLGAMNFGDYLKSIKGKK